MTEFSESLPLTTHEVRIPPAREFSLSSIRLLMAGRMTGKSDWVERFFERPALAFVEEGEGWIAKGGAPLEHVAAPAVFFLSPGAMYRYGPEAGHWDERYLVFEGSRVDEWVAAGWFPEQARPFSVMQPQSLARAHARIMDFAEAKAKVDADRAALELEALLFRLYAERESRSLGRTRMDGRVELWRADPGRAWDLKEEAARCGLSYSRFREILRERYEISPHQLLLDFRMELAGRLLLERPSPVKAIARETGFATIEGFYRAFQKHYGEAPAQFRKRRRL